MGRKIILFELNEVPLKIIDRYCEWYPNSFFAKHLPLCRQYETYTEDHNLSPWTTWPTLHRGVYDQKHTIHHFGQEMGEINEAYPSIWEILSAHGVKTGVCGSLHSYPMPENFENYSFFLPDCFAAGSECFPKELSSFQEFNLRMSRDSARNVSRKLHWGPALKMLAQLPSLGFKIQTAVDVIGQLASERLVKWKHVRRRTYQVVLAFDIFMKQLENTSPAFATFFTNHVASSMHRYWAAAFPEDYNEFGMDEQWVNTYRKEIDFTMGKFDQFFERLVRFLSQHPDYQLWIATSMGQAATVAGTLETELGVRDLHCLMQKLGLLPTQWERRPAMIPQVNVCVAPESVLQFQTNLEDLIIDGSPLAFERREGGFFSLTFGHLNLHVKQQFAVLGGATVSFEELGLSIEKIEDKCGATAYHIPQGSLLIYDPLLRSTSQAGKPLAKRVQISTLDIAPQILRNYAVPVPLYMAQADREHLL